MFFEVIYKVKGIKNDSWHSMVFKTEKEADIFIKKAESKGCDHFHKRIRREDNKVHVHHRRTGRT